MRIGDLSTYPSWEAHVGSGVAHIAISLLAVGALPFPSDLRTGPESISLPISGRQGSLLGNHFSPSSGAQARTM